MIVKKRYMLAIPSCQDTRNTWLALDPWPHVDLPEMGVDHTRSGYRCSISNSHSCGARPYRGQPFQFQSQPSNQSARGRPSLSRPLHIRSHGIKVCSRMQSCVRRPAPLPDSLLRTLSRSMAPGNPYAIARGYVFVCFFGHELKSSSHPLATGCRFDAATRPPPISGHASSLFAGDDRLVSPAPGANQDYLEHQRRNGSEGGQTPCLGFSRHSDLPLPL